LQIICAHSLTLARWTLDSLTMKDNTYWTCVRSNWETNKKAKVSLEVARNTVADSWPQELVHNLSKGHDCSPTVLGEEVVKLTKTFAANVLEWQHLIADTLSACEAHLLKVVETCMGQALSELGACLPNDWKTLVQSLDASAIEERVFSNPRHKHINDNSKLCYTIAGQIGLLYDAEAEACEQTKQATTSLHHFRQALNAAADGANQYIAACAALNVIFRLAPKCKGKPTQILKCISDRREMMQAKGLKAPAILGQRLTELEESCGLEVMASAQGSAS